MKRYILASILGVVSLLTWGQELGKWTVYAAYHNSTYNIPVEDKIYSLCDGSLYSYNTTDTEILTYSKADWLNDTEITHIAYSTVQKKLLITYQNANIDLLYENGDVTNMADFKNKIMADKTINSINVEGNYAYLSTNFGLVVVDMEKEEFTNTYTFNNTVYCSVVHNNIIYASTPNGIYQGKLSDNLLDMNNWTLKLTFSPHKAVIYQGYIYATVSGYGLYRINLTSFSYERLIAGNFIYLNQYENILMVGNNNLVYQYTALDTYTKIAGDNKFNYLSYSKNSYWASNYYGGLQPYRLNTTSNELEPTASAIIPNSPIRNLFSVMNYTSNNRLLVAGGSHNYTNNRYAGTLMYHEGDTWTNLQEEGIATATGQTYVNLTSLAQDPADPTHHFASSFGHGVYEFKDNKFVKQYHADNSDLYSVLPTSSSYNEYIWVNGLTYDNQGNLWMLNNQVDTIIKVLKKDNSWVKIYKNEIAGIPTLDQILFDSRGWIWINSRRNTSVSTAGVFCIQYTGTPENAASNTSYYHSTITNQDGQKYTPDQVYCLAEDKNGYIWVGTNLGPFIIDRPTSFTQETFTYHQVKVARNDGSNYADYLLSDIHITAIAIDGGNRKWFGTNGNGVYLVSADGQETVHHFTTENSPLLSNNINSIAINGENGEVMIGTESGLISFISDATEPEYELSESNVEVYPNPVRPDYFGDITIRGLSFNSEVKITSTTGQLITEGISMGGTFTWNAKDSRGRRVASGVYNILASDEEGKKGIVAKVVFIK